MSLNRSAAHTALIREAAEWLAINGYSAWVNQTGVWFDDDGRPHKFGKLGSGDIMLVLAPYGRHCELEGKTGDAKQRKTQKDHQKYVVEKNGGFYAVFHSITELKNIMDNLSNGT